MAREVGGNQKIKVCVFGFLFVCLFALEGVDSCSGDEEDEDRETTAFGNMRLVIDLRMTLSCV